MARRYIPPPPPPPPPLTPISHNLQQQPQPLSLQPQPQAPSVHQIDINDDVPFFQIKNIKVNIDSGLDDYITSLQNIQNAPLKQIQINQPQSATGTPGTSVIPKFINKDRGVPEKPITLDEHMLYHSKKSIKVSPLIVNIPKTYLYNEQKVKKYIETNQSDINKEIKRTILREYGGNTSCLFYYHTISSNGDMNSQEIKKTQELIKQWHNEYSEYIFFNNAKLFFIENKENEVAKEEYITLYSKLDYIESSLSRIITENVNKYTEINTRYTNLYDASNNAGDGILNVHDLLDAIDDLNDIFTDSDPGAHDKLNDYLTAHRPDPRQAMSGLPNFSTMTDEIDKELSTFIDNIKKIVDVDTPSWKNTYLLLLQDKLKLIIETQKSIDKIKSSDFKQYIDYFDKILNNVSLNLTYKQQQGAPPPPSYNDVNRSYRELLYNAHIDHLSDHQKEFFNTFFFNKLPAIQGEPDIAPVTTDEVSLMYYATIKAISNLFVDIHLSYDQIIKELSSEAIIDNKKNISNNNKILDDICDLVVLHEKYPANRINEVKPAKADLLYDDNTYFMYGNVDDVKYQTEWNQRSAIILRGIQKMKEKINKKINGNEVVYKNLKYNLILINTIHVFGTLFPPTKKIWYSEDINTGIIRLKSNWVNFNLSSTEILSKTGITQYKNVIFTELFNKQPSPPDIDLQFIKPFCIFQIENVNKADGDSTKETAAIPSITVNKPTSDKLGEKTFSEVARDNLNCKKTFDDITETANELSSLFTSAITNISNIGTAIPPQPNQPQPPNAPVNAPPRNIPPNAPVNAPPRNIPPNARPIPNVQPIGVGPRAARRIPPPPPPLPPPMMPLGPGPAPIVVVHPPPAAAIVAPVAAMEPLFGEVPPPPPPPPEPEPQQLAPAVVPAVIPPAPVGPAAPPAPPAPPPPPDVKFPLAPPLPAPPLFLNPVIPSDRV